MRRRATTILLYSILGVVTLLTLGPVLWMVSASFMPTGETGLVPPRVLPSQITFEHYTALFSQLNLTRYFINSIVVSVSITLISLLLNSMAGYAFAKFRFRGRDQVFRALLSALVVPAQVTMLPLFLLLRELGLVNTYLGIIVPGMTSVFGIFLIRQFAMSLPDSLIEAARMDGASELRIYFRIILPLLRPILVTLALFTFMGAWNDFMWPLIVMTDNSMYTLPVALANLSGEHEQDVELMMAGSVVTILPVVVLFLSFQRSYIRGIMLGGVKE